MSLLSKIYEHLITKGKYNKLKVDYNVIQQEYERKVIENEQLRHQYKVIKEVWEKKLQEQEDTIIELKRRKRK